MDKMLFQISGDLILNILGVVSSHESNNLSLHEDFVHLGDGDIGCHLNFVQTKFYLFF